MTPEKERHYANLLGTRSRFKHSDALGLYVAMIVFVLFLMVVVWGITEVRGF